MDGEEEARMLSERSLQYALECGREERKAINVAELLIKKENDCLQTILSLNGFFLLLL